MARWVRAGTALALVASLGGCLVDFDESLIPRGDARPADAGVDDLPQVSEQGAPDLAADAAPVPDLPPCDEDPRCTGDDLMRCGEVIASCPLGCSGDPAACAELTPSNGLPAPARAGVVSQRAELTIEAVAVLDACTGQLDGKPLGPGLSFQQVAQASGPDIGVVQARTITIAPGGVLRVSGSCALALVADEAIEIRGVADLAGGGDAPYVAGPGGGQGATSAAAQGCGAGGAAEIGAGGGGGGYGSKGASGGGGAVGDGGKACGEPSLSPLVGGSGGAGGCIEASCPAGHGGGGGGALALVAGGRVALAGSAVVHLGGGGGEGGIEGGGGGGGGGSGGGLLIEAPVIAIGALVVVNAGGGGGGGVANNPVSARGKRPGSTLAAAKGGSGSVNGGAGATSTSAPEVGQEPGGEPGGGGGGGGLGRLRLNSRDGQVPLPDVNAVVSQAKLET